jgi:hypothetical protein
VSTGPPPIMRSMRVRQLRDTQARVAQASRDR